MRARRRHACIAAVAWLAACGGRDAADDAATHVARAHALEQRGDARGAYDEYRAALAKDPRSRAASRTWYELGRLARTELHDSRGAAEALRKAIELEPGFPEAHFALGTVLIELGDPEGGSAEVQAALSLAPADVAWRQDAENALVLAHLRQREKSGATPDRGGR